MARRSTASRLRARQQSARIGDEVRTAALALGMTRQQVARRAGVSWATVVNVEIGEPGVQIDTLCAVGEAVGLDIVLRAYPGRQPTLRDTGQLQYAELLVAQAHDRWQPQVELAVGQHGEAVDLALFGSHEIQDYEIETLATDFQRQLRRADQKRLLLAAQHRRPVRLVLAIRDTPANRAALAPHMAVIRTNLPAGSREILASLRSGEPLGRDGLVWFRPRRLRAVTSQSSEAAAPRP